MIWAKFVFLITFNLNTQENKVKQKLTSFMCKLNLEMRHEK